MPYERRLYGRTDVSWRGHVTLSDGPQYVARVLDVSAGGARLAMPVEAKPRRQELLELNAFRNGFWSFGLNKPVCALGRIVRVCPHEDQQQIEVAVRFHTPLRKTSRRFRLPLISREWAIAPCASPCA
jgi:hypothetical protein